VDADGNLVGIISEYDLLGWQARLMDALAKDPALEPAEYARRLETGRVQELMSGPATTIDEAAPLSAALHMFLERGFRRLPVTRDGRLVGVLARADLLKAMAEQWAATAGRGSP